MTIETKSYHNFWQQIHKIARDKGFPLRVMFELTYKCNFRCRHCYVPFSYRKLGELKTKEVFSILGQLKDLGCFYLGFTGGEPFIRKDLLQILWYAKKIGFQIIIYTNGSLIDKNIANELMRINPNKVDITIPAISKNAFEKISGVDGSRDKVFNAIELLHKRGIKLGFKTCFLKENGSEIKDIQSFANSLGALHRLDSMLLPRLNGSREPYKYRSQKSEVRSQRNPGEYNLGSELRTPNSELFECGVGRTQVAITPQGELKMCVIIDYPKYKILDTQVTKSQGHKVTSPKANLRDAWQRLKKLVNNIKPDENYHCDKCKLEPYCKWCPARGWLENRNFSTCDSESWHWAEFYAGLYQKQDENKISACK